MSNAFKNFQKESNVYKSDKLIKNKYCVDVQSKTRYVNPLVKTGNNYTRINNLSEQANSEIQNYLDFPKGGYYTYFDFDFKPY